MNRWTKRTTDNNNQHILDMILSIIIYNEYLYIMSKAKIKNMLLWETRGARGASSAEQSKQTSKQQKR